MYGKKINADDLRLISSVTDYIRCNRGSTEEERERERERERKRESKKNIYTLKHASVTYTWRCDLDKR